MRGAVLPFPDRSDDMQNHTQPRRVVKLDRSEVGQEEVAGHQRPVERRKPAGDDGGHECQDQ